MSFWKGEYCLICHDEIEPEVSWNSIFGSEERDLVCGDCKQKFSPILGETCAICGRPFSSLDAEYRFDSVCYDCKRWEEDEQWAGSLDKNFSLFNYEDFIKEVIARYKFRGDYIIAEVFAPDVQKVLKGLKFDFPAPIPLSEERLYERGFNQAEAIIRTAGYQPVNLFKRFHTEKQSKKSRNERIHIDQVFKLESNLDLTSKTILLIDDIYTTGSTLRHAAKLLKENGAAKVYSLTLAR